MWPRIIDAGERGRCRSNKLPGFVGSGNECGGGGGGAGGGFSLLVVDDCCLFFMPFILSCVVVGKHLIQL